MTAFRALEHIWSLACCDATALDDIRLFGDDPGLPSVYRVGALANATIGAAALAAAEYHRLRTGCRQRVEVEQRRALAAFRSERYLRIDDGPPPQLRDPLMGFFETRDGRWIQLHTNFEHHRTGVVKLLGCKDDYASVSAAIRERNGASLDQALADAGLCAALVRSPNEWAALTQASALASLPLFEIERIDAAGNSDSGRVPLGRDAGDGAASGRAATPCLPSVSAARPLSGVRVLDLTRIIAGPVAGRTLAQHGADVMLVNGPHLPNIAPLVIDNGRGKRSVFLDLRREAERATLHALLQDADVFLQAYRPGALAGHGFSPEALALAKPGIVYVSICAYGPIGPWARRRGFDSLVQSASGIAWTEAQAAGTPAPRHLPCQALDHATGYLAAFGAMVALMRRATEGGSWHVKVSLAQTGQWLQSLGTLANGWRVPDVSMDDVRDLMQTMDTPFGKVLAVAPAETLSATPPRFERPSVPLGTNSPSWAA